MTRITKTGNCLVCGKQTEFLLHRQVFKGGQSHLLWVCESCGNRNPDNSRQLYCPRNMFSGDVNTLPEYADPFKPQFEQPNFL